MGQDSLAEEFEHLTKDLYGKASSFKLKSFALAEKGNEALDAGEVELAKYLFDSAHQYALGFNNHRHLAHSEFNFARYYRKVNLSDSAISHLKKALEYASLSNNKELTKDYFKELSSIYFDTDNYKQAILSLRKSDSLRNVLYSEGVTMGIKKIDLAFEQKENAQTIAMLETQQQLSQINLKNQRIIKGLLLLALLAATTIAIILYRLFRNRTIRAKELAQKNIIIESALDSNRTLLKEIHHRVKNNLQVVSSLLHLQSKYVQDRSARGAIKTSSTRVEAVSLLHQRLYQKHDGQAINIKEYFEDLCENIFETYQLAEQKITFHANVEPLLLDVDTVIPLGLITNELICNALKHAFAGKDAGHITLTVHKNDGIVILNLKDDGRGVPFNQIPDNINSLGLELIQSFAKKLDAKLSIDNKEGSSFTFQFRPRMVQPKYHARA